MLGVLLLAPLTVSAPSQNTHASEQGKLLCKEYKAMKMDALVSMILSRLTDRDYSSEQDKKEYFRFLREVAAVYDEYAEALLSCRKQGQCHVSPIQDSCSSFSKRIDSLSKLDRLETKDIMKKEVDDLLGEDEYADYIPFQMPKVTFYLAIICRNYR
jgi:5-methylcytosine-specific restriction endonuclease McrBC regulatory subunit McrC